MGFVTLGIFTATTQGVEGGIFQMISHGLVSGALFLCVGVVYDRLHTRRSRALRRHRQEYAKICDGVHGHDAGSVGLPGTSGFVGNSGTAGYVQVNTVVALFATTGVVLGAAYMLVLYRRVVFGPQNNPDAAMHDLNPRGNLIFIPFVVLVIWLGVAPGYVMERVSPSVSKLLTTYHERVDAAEEKLAVEQAALEAEDAAKANDTEDDNATADDAPEKGKKRNLEPEG